MKTSFMKVKLLLNKKLNEFSKSFPLLVAAFLLSGSYAKAQIMYTDINPDISGAAVNQPVLGTTFTFGVWAGSAFATDPYGAAGTPVMIAGPATDQIAIVDAGTMIGPTSNWNIDAWNNNGAATFTDKYLGFRVGTAGNFRYGWFKVTIVFPATGAPTWTVKSYGYQNTVNTAISAGDMGTGTANVAVTGITVNGQGGTSTITTNDGTLQMTTTIMPANATNQAVSWSVTPTGLATINATGLLTAQANGTVTVKATAQDSSNISGTKTITISGQTVGIKEINRLASSIYPNPVKNEIMLQFGKEESIRNVRIINVAGQVVYKDDNAGKSKLITINTASLPEGLYILTFENAEGKQGLKKFAKNK